MRLREFIWHRMLRRPHILAVQTVGSGQPVLFLHGLGARREIWSRLISRMDHTRWRTIAVDLLGFGESPRPDWRAYSVDDHADAIIATVNSLGVKKQPIVIVAHSMGCLVAAHIAARYPRRVARLILYAPPLFADDPVFPKHARKRERYFAFFEYIASHPQIIFIQRRWFWRLVKRSTGQDMDEETWLPFERSLRNTVMQQHVYDELLTLSVPTDIVHGKLDFVVIRTEINKMLRANKNITLHTVTSAHNLTNVPVKYVLSLLESAS